MEPFGVVLSQRGSRCEVEPSHHIDSFPLVTRSGATLGVVYGVLLSGHCGDGIAIEGDRVLVDRDIRDFRSFETEVLDHLHGTYVAVTHDTHGLGAARLYPDSGGGIPIVFCAESRRAGSSASMFLADEEYDERFLTERYRVMVEREGAGGWIAGTLSAHRGVERLLPNHYLDLSTWEAHRFWPREGEFRFGTSVEEASEIIATAMTGFVEAAARQFRAAIALTAGFDSRLIAAASRSVSDQLEAFTLSPEDPGIDQILARELAATLSLRHRLVPIQEATDEQAALWDRCVGHTVREVNRRLHPTLSNLDYEVILTGMYGEIGRSRLYRQDTATINDTVATPELVVSRLTLPLDRDLASNVARWLDGLSWLPCSVILDLAYNELRAGSWAMAQSPIQKALQMELLPYTQRSVQNAFMSVPPQDKGTTALFDVCARRMWPASMDIPVNRFGDHRDWLAKARKAFRREKVVRFLRNRLGTWRRGSR